MTSNPFRIGDPVMDGAQGRAMIVLDAPDQTVAEWSDANNYDLLENYANSKFDPDADEPVVECVYVSDIRSEPSKTYTFPVSRCKLIDAHHADDGRRVADRVVVDVLADIFAVAMDLEDTPETDHLATVFTVAGVDDALVDLARELADVDRTVVADD